MQVSPLTIEGDLYRMSRTKLILRSEYGVFLVNERGKNNSLSRRVMPMDVKGSNLEKEGQGCFEAYSTDETIYYPLRTLDEKMPTYTMIVVDGDMVVQTGERFLATDNMMYGNNCSNPRHMLDIHKHPVKDPNNPDNRLCIMKEEEFLEFINNHRVEKVRMM